MERYYFIMIFYWGMSLVCLGVFCDEIVGLRNDKWSDRLKVEETRRQEHVPTRSVHPQRKYRLLQN